MARDRKTLTHEDRMLWRQVAETARPLAGRKDPLASIEAAPRIDHETPGKNQDKKKRSDPSTAGSAPPPSVPARPRAVSPSRPGVHPIEKPIRRKLAKGRLAIDARIDLHGLVQSEAHDLLRGFLMRAHARSLRHVLVITGKGTSMGSEGALRRAVPQWLSKPEFRRIVSGYENAARNHGGRGALYVRLKRDRTEGA